MPPLENMAFPPFAGFPPCAVCAASYAKNDAIGFKRDNAQFNHAALYPLSTGRVLYSCQGTGRTLDYKGMANTLRKVYFLSFDCKGLECLRCMYGVVWSLWAGPCPTCLSGLLLSSFAIVSVVLVCPTCREEGSRLPAVCPHQRGTVTVYANRGKSAWFFE